MREVKDMERTFRVFHSEKIDRKPQPIERLVKLILEKSTLSTKIVEFFVKARFFRRIKKLNTQPLTMKEKKVYETSNSLHNFQIDVNSVTSVMNKYFFIYSVLFLCVFTITQSEESFADKY
jgi:hypothetical protein